MQSEQPFAESCRSLCFVPARSCQIACNNRGVGYNAVSRYAGIASDAENQEIKNQRREAPRNLRDKGENADTAERKKPPHG